MEHMLVGLNLNLEIFFFFFKKGVDSLMRLKIHKNLGVRLFIVTSRIIIKV